jgi:hypothetical protein
MSLFGVIVVVVVVLGIAGLILAFERRRARQIEHDVSDMARRRGRGSSRR